MLITYSCMKSFETGMLIAVNMGLPLHAVTFVPKGVFINNGREKFSASLKTMVSVTKCRWVGFKCTHLTASLLPACRTFWRYAAAAGYSEHN